MKNGRIFLILIGVVLCIMIVLTIINSLNKTETADTTDVTEIVPGEEMTEEQERQTIISLYYTNTETNTLVPEARVIDAKNLLENPYKTLVEYLAEAPKNEKLQSSLPNGTIVNEASISGDTVILDLSQEFIENQSSETINLGIYSIVNTLTELNDVNSVRILINGEENISIEGTDISFSESFSRQETVI